MIEKLLPPPISVAEAFGDPAEAVLLPAEEEVVRRAMDKRRREFTTARWCARRALARLDVPPLPILPGERGAPQWPDGIVGSMTHCDGYRAAAVARATDLLTIGIDAEPHLPLPEGVLDTISLPSERARQDVLGATDPRIHWDRLLFCAKEAVYKAWFPLATRWLDFTEADITLAPDGTFFARLLVPAPEIPGAAFDGRWLAAEGILTATIAVPV